MWSYNLNTALDDGKHLETLADQSRTEPYFRAFSKETISLILVIDRNT